MWHTNEEKVTQKACLCKCLCKCYESLWRRLQFECMTTMWRHHYRWRVNVWRKRLSDIQGKSWYCQNFVILYFPLYSIVYQFVYYISVYWYLWWWTISPRGYHLSSSQWFGTVHGLLDIFIIEIYSSEICIKTKVLLPQAYMYPPVTVNRSVKTFLYNSHSNWHLYQR